MYFFAMNRVGPLLLLGALLYPNAASADITAAGDINPAYNSSDPWVLATALRVGDTGAGTLTIDKGSTAHVDGVNIGASAGSTGMVTVDGADSEMNSSSWFTLGNYGDGTLLISNSGSVSNENGAIYGASSAATVTGDGSTWDNSGTLYVGLASNLLFPPNVDTSNTLHIEAGGAVSSATGIIGDRQSDPTATHSGVAVVTGGGSTWSNSGSLYVGRTGGIGTLTIEDGGVVSNVDGHLAGATSDASVIGPGSNWTNAGDLYIAQGIGGVSNSSLTIQGGASVSNMTGYIASGGNSNGDVTVTGTGSTWTNHADLIIGSVAHGILRVEQGAAVTSVNGQIGAFQFIGSYASGVAEVSGANSSWALSQSLYVGGDDSMPFASGTLDVYDSGQIAVADTLKVWNTGTVQGDGSLSATTLSNGGALAPGNPTGTLSLTGDYTQEPGGTMQIQLIDDALSAISFGHLDVIGNVTMDGELELLIDPGMLTRAGNLDILTSTGPITGAFSSLNFPTIPGLDFDITYNTNAVTLSITLIGDLNADGFVGIDDLNIILSNWNQSVPPADPLADPSGDGFVGIDDLNAVLSNWNAGTPPATNNTIPEPATVGLLAVCVMCGLTRRQPHDAMLVN